MKIHKIIMPFYHAFNVHRVTPWHCRQPEAATEFNPPEPAAYGDEGTIARTLYKHRATGAEQRWRSMLSNQRRRTGQEQQQNKEKITKHRSSGIIPPAYTKYMVGAKVSIEHHSWREGPLQPKDWSSGGVCSKAPGIQLPPKLPTLDI